MSFPPPDDVARSVSDTELQSRNSIDDLGRELAGELRQIRLGRIAEGASLEIRWIYFKSPERTWQNECGRAGWILFDPCTCRQLHYIETEIS